MSWLAEIKKMVNSSDLVPDPGKTSDEEKNLCAPLSVDIYPHPPVCHSGQNHGRWNGYILSLQGHLQTSCTQFKIYMCSFSSSRVSDEPEKALDLTKETIEMELKCPQTANNVGKQHRDNAKVVSRKRRKIFFANQHLCVCNAMFPDGQTKATNG